MDPVGSIVLFVLGMLAGASVMVGIVIACIPVSEFEKFIERRAVPRHDQTDLGASDDRPLGPDNIAYRQG